MLQYSQCRIPYRKDSREAVRKKVAKKLHCETSELHEFHVVKKSVDARKKPDIYFTYTVQFSVKSEAAFYQRNKRDKHLSIVSNRMSLVEKNLSEARKMCRENPEYLKRKKIVIVGAGPAGLFCAYYLCLCGFQPVLIERGAPMEERTKDVNSFWESGLLNPESNVSFGEGGAGTFSDGKLNTGVKDKTGRTSFILNTFVQFGAGEDILYDAKPHIGTDVLRRVIVAMREEMIRLGCVFHFHTKMTGIIQENGVVRGVRVHNNSIFPCDKLVLAIGHSARDTFEMLRNMRIEMSQKPFAVGVRVQHLQSDIDRMQYGFLDDKLPVSPYKCTGRTEDGRGVYSFCMCPGGYVVNASSEAGGLVVNGMSNVKRDSGNANSAIVVAVAPEDFDGEDCLAGVEYQRKMERAAYQLCQGKIPVQRFEDFRNNCISEASGRVKPCVKGQWQWENLRKALPKKVINGIIEGMEQFDHRMKGFADGDTLLLGVETRTSSPVRIERDDAFVSTSLKGLYPCGEGAGYAGGIMSAAMDGMRIAMHFVEMQCIFVETQ